MFMSNLQGAAGAGDRATQPAGCRHLGHHGSGAWLRHCCGRCVARQVGWCRQGRRYQRYGQIMHMGCQQGCNAGQCVAVSLQQFDRALLAATVPPTLPATLPACLPACRNVVAVEGDSAFGFSGMECETICR